MPQPDYEFIHFKNPVFYGRPVSPKTYETIPPEGPDNWPRLELLETGGARLHFYKEPPVDIPESAIASLVHRDRSATEEFLGGPGAEEEAEAKPKRGRPRKNP
jgi:hypothetical protein